MKQLNFRINKSIGAFDEKTLYRLWFSTLPKEYRDCIGTVELAWALYKNGYLDIFYAHAKYERNLRCTKIKDFPSVEEIASLYLELLPWYSRWYFKAVLLGHLNKTLPLHKPCKI